MKVPELRASLELGQLLLVSACLCESACGTIYKTTFTAAPGLRWSDLSNSGIMCTGIWKPLDFSKSEQSAESAIVEGLLAILLAITA